MHIRNLLNDSPELFSIWDKILNGELMQLIEGDGFTIEDETELLATEFIIKPFWKPV